MRLPGVPCASHWWHVPGDFLWSSGKPTGHLAEIARGTSPKTYGGTKKRFDSWIWREKCHVNAAPHWIPRNLMKFELGTDSSKNEYLPSTHEQSMYSILSCTFQRTMPTSSGFLEDVTPEIRGAARQGFHFMA